MSDKRRKRRRKKSPVFFAVFLGAVLLLIIFVIGYNAYREMTGEQDADRAEETGVEFPYTSEDGNLQITSLIQFTGPNMDAENADGEDIAGLQVRNISGRYLDEAEIKVNINDGTEYSFLVQDLPAGTETVAFELASQSYDGQAACREIECTTQMGDISMREDAVQITVDGSKLIITNISEQQIDNAVVIYHCTTGDSYIGGLSYEIPVSGLAAGESFEYEDSKYLLGTPEAVGVEID